MEEIKENVTMEEASDAEDAAEAVAVEKEPEIIESMDDYAKELEDSLKRIHAGDVMEATVVAVDDKGVSVDLDYYAPGWISLEDMSDDPNFSLSADVQIGDTFKAIVKTVDDGAGNILLSKKAGDLEFAWEKLEKLKEDTTPVTGKIAEVVKAGAIMFVEGIRGFIPASRLDLTYVEDTAPYAGRTIQVLVTEVNREKGKLILSAKELLTEAALAKRAETVKNLAVGSAVEGTVESIKEYGAFVDIGNDLSGLLHVSEISLKRVTHPKTVLKVGQKIKVMIKKIDNGKISLSMKALEEARVEAEEVALEEEAHEYKSEYVPNTPFAALLKDIKL